MRPLDDATQSRLAGLESAEDVLLESGQPERFLNKAIGPSREQPSRPIVGGIPAGKKNSDRRLSLFQPFQDGPGIRFRKRQIQQRDVGVAVRRSRQLEGRGAIRGRDNPEAEVLQHVAERGEHQRLVIDQQDARLWPFARLTVRGWGRRFHVYRPGREQSRPGSIGIWNPERLLR
jgi:hypothetical protein